MARLFFAIALLTITPVLAQGITNSRDASGNLPRDKGEAASTMQRGALVSSGVQSRQPVVTEARVGHGIGNRLRRSRCALQIMH
jgi:hypothetical protein